MKVLRALALLFSLPSFVIGQQLITTTNQAGETIVEQITTNAFGQPLTQILQTLGPAATSPATSLSPATSPTPTSPTPTTTPPTAATTSPNEQGPVGQPGTTPETPGGPTPFVYTTTDANGNYVTVSATFTPTFPQTIPYTPTTSGTILKYSDWLSQIGNNTGALNQPVASQAANAASRAGANISLLSGAVLCTVLAGVVSGWMFIP
ncbi:hypothetical protein EDB85DRAFT_1935386 [Lactarius pseudohatsudake]|nr:hypothetical protein EDB85DRAFT_1935386 [Lactarius pseudohatsudake]